MRVWFSMHRCFSFLGALLSGVLPMGLLVASCATSRPDLAGPAPVGEQPTPVVTAAPSPSPVAAPEKPISPNPAVCAAFVKPGVLKRAAVVRAVDAGIGRWLAGGAEVERKIAKSRFQGWEIRRLYAGDPCYATVDLRPYDVVIQVNGKPIEKPEQAFDVLTSLRTASELVVDFLRDGQPQKLILQIADE
jgi:S1-C subfamily serine protease